MIPDNRPDLTPADVWEFVAGGCNAAEVAAYAHVTESTAKAMMANARRLYAQGAAA